MNEKMNGYIIQNSVCASGLCEEKRNAILTLETPLFYTEQSTKEIFKCSVPHKEYYSDE